MIQGGQYRRKFFAKKFRRYCPSLCTGGLYDIGYIAGSFLPNCVGFLPTNFGDIAPPHVNNISITGPPRTY